MFLGYNTNFIELYWLKPGVSIMFIYRNPYALNVISMGRGSFNQGCQVQKNLNLATSSFKKGQILKNEKGQIKAEFP